MSENRTAPFLQIISQALVVGAGVLYLFGFVIVSVYDASHGIADFSLFRAKVIAVGCLFALFLALPIIITLRTFKVFGLQRPGALRTRFYKPENQPYVIADVATSLPFVCASVALFPLSSLYQRPFTWNMREAVMLVVVSIVYVTCAVLSRDRFDTHPIQFLCISLILTGVFFAGLFRYADKSLFWLVIWLSSVCFVTVAVWRWVQPEEIRNTEWERLLLVLIPFIVGIYAVKLYPKIKPQYGGGAPVPVVLHLGKKIPAFDSEDPSVSLLDETEQGYYVLSSSRNDRAIFVARSLVEDVEFLSQNSGAQAAPAPTKP